MIFLNRRDAGHRLASVMRNYKIPDGVVLALPRGGVPVGYEIAKSLNLPLDVLVVRKIGSPTNPEFGIGAVTAKKAVFIDNKMIGHINIHKEKIRSIISSELREAVRREKLYRKGKTALHLENKTIILADDGLATGVTAKAAIMQLKEEKCKKIILAVPVAPADVIEEIKSLVSEVQCLDIRSEFSSVGNAYMDYSQTTDNEVVNLLKNGLFEVNSQLRRSS